jgi:OsmC-like protein
MERYEWSVRVAADQKDRATVFVRSHRFEVGAPVTFDVEHPLPTALEHVLGAFGADLCVGLRAATRRRRLDVDAIEATVHGALENPAVYLGVVGEEGSPRLARIRLKVYVSTLDEEADVRAAWQETLARSPLHHTLRAAVALELEVKVAI